MSCPWSAQIRNQRGQRPRQHRDIDLPKGIDKSDRGGMLIWTFGSTTRRRTLSALSSLGRCATNLDDASRLETSSLPAIDLINDTGFAVDTARLGHKIGKAHAEGLKRIPDGLHLLLREVLLPLADMT